ncbi:MAG: M50 family metallopeptidase [Bacillus sp. (in: firmicutes)]
MSSYLSLANKVHIHPVTWLVVGIALLTAHFYEIFLLLFIVFVHEVGHAAVAHRFGWRIRSVTLLPFGGVLDTEEHGNRPLAEEMKVILAGPLQHLWLFLISLFLHWSGMIGEEAFRLFAFMNSSICLFNLLPIWPLDGGKLLFLVLSKRSTFLDSHKLILWGSSVLTLLLFLLSLFVLSINLNSIVIFLFLVFTLVMEWRQRQYVFMRFLLDRHYGKKDDPLELEPINVDEKDSIQSILKLFRRGCKHSILVHHDGKLTHSLDENELLYAYFTEKRVTAKVGDLLYYY